MAVRLNARRGARFELRAGLQRVTKNDRVAGCGVRPVRAGEVEVVVAEQRAHFAGLGVCGRVWLCPVCSPKIRQGRAEEIGRMIGTALARGAGAEFVTLTGSHHRGHGLADLLNAQGVAWKAVRDDRAVKALFKRLGYWGQLLVVEITHGDGREGRSWNGWHPHRHMVMLFERPLSEVERAELEETLWKPWDRSLKRSGFTTKRQYGAKVLGVTAAEGVSWYLAKVEGRSLGLEVARGDLKVGRKGRGRTPFELLEGALTGDVADVELWLEYEQATAGRMMYRPTPGLRKKLLGVEDAPTDEELAEGEVGGQVVAVLWREAWRWCLAASPGAVAVLEAAEKGVEALEGYLRQTLPLEPGNGSWMVLAD